MCCMACTHIHARACTLTRLHTLTHAHTHMRMHMHMPARPPCGVPARVHGLTHHLGDPPPQCPVPTHCLLCHRLCTTCPQRRRRTPPRACPWRSRASSSRCAGGRGGQRGWAPPAGRAAWAHRPVRAAALRAGGRGALSWPCTLLVRWALCTLEGMSRGVTRYATHAWQALHALPIRLECWSRPAASYVAPC